MFGGVSGAAVDGKLSRFFSDGSTTMTSLDTEPWWQASRVGVRGLFQAGILGVVDTPFFHGDIRPLLEVFPRVADEIMVAA